MLVLPTTPSVDGESVFGTVIGGYRVIEFSGYTYDKNGNKQHHLWEVECVECGERYVRQKQHVRNSKLGCSNCKGELQSGTRSAHWRGGEFVPAHFVAKVKHGLERRSRTLTFDLSFDYLDALWLAQQGRCAYTGEELWFGRSKVNGNASLDRIDSALGYIEGNVQFVHKDINIMKWDFPESRFLELCYKITEMRNESE
jgi:hypothetical protein